MHLTMDEAGRSVRVIITSGTVNDCTKANDLIRNIKREALFADKAYDTNTVDIAAKNVV